MPSPGDRTGMGMKSNDHGQNVPTMTSEEVRSDPSTE